jgi:hypothetical protein
MENCLLFALSILHTAPRIRKPLEEFAVQKPLLQFVIVYGSQSSILDSTLSYPIGL